MADHQTNKASSCRVGLIASGEPLPWADEIEIPGPIPRPPVNMV